MKVSCICPTYNRIATHKHLLEEAVESFLKQTYEDKELIIINDHPMQNIIFDHPQVKIMNCTKRFSTLGDKYNFAIRYIASGQAICPWEDDDISLPNRLSYSVERLGDADYFNPKAYFFLCNGKIQFEQMTGYAHNCSIFTRMAFRRVGGYPSVSGPQDAHMDGMLRHGKVIDGPIPKEYTFFIYRWGVSNLHLSGFPDTQKAYDDYAKEAIFKGNCTLEPHWEQDYVSLVKGE